MWRQYWLFTHNNKEERIRKMSSRVQFEYDKELMDLSVRVDGGASKTISIRELEPMEKILSMLKIPYESFVGGMMADTDYLKFQYDNDSLYKLGVEAGVKQMMDKIQKHCELGKPVLANGELYFFKDARQNLIDIMDDIDADWKAEQGIIHKSSSIENLTFYI